ncbi:MAG: hypothetical protein LIO93_05095 [Bacteroidales bacterium]|nr:hypothetical protein [Bacteroidales bacterium]
MSGILFLFFFGCQDVELLEQTTDTFPELRSIGDGKFDALGHGYDITGKYLDASSTRALVVDVQSLNNKNLITPANLYQTTSSQYSGTNIVSFSQDMSTGVGLTFLSFVGSFNANFKSSYKFDSKKSYAFYSHEFLRKSFTISATTNDLKSYLTANFKNHLISATPEEIVNLYGTHIMKNVYVGARLEAFLETESTSSDKKGAATAKMGKTFKSLFKVDLSYDVNENLAKQTRNSKFFYKTVGGITELVEGEYVDVDGTTIKSPKLDMIKWSQSINDNNSRFVKINKNSLIPIYDLIDNATKKAAVKAYVEKYINDSKPQSLNNYSSSGGVRKIPLKDFNENQGAGVAIADINKNGIPDLILMALDNPKDKDNYYHYQILFDIDEYGNSNMHSPVFKLGKAAGTKNQGASIAVADLNNNGIPDIVFACADNPKKENPIYHRVAFDIDITGKPKYISDIFKTADMGNEHQGLGIDIYDFNNNGKPDIMFMVYDNPLHTKNLPNVFKYKIGYDLDSSGRVSGGFSQVYEVDGVGNEGQGSGVAIADINKNGKPDILLMAMDNPDGANKFRYKILWDVNSAGYTYAQPTYVEPAFTNMDLGDKHQGADCIVYDINKDGELDVLFLAIDNPKGHNEFRYVTGFGLTTDGYVRNWR